MRRARSSRQLERLSGTALTLFDGKGWRGVAHRAGLSDDDIDALILSIPPVNSNTAIIDLRDFKSALLSQQKTLNLIFQVRGREVEQRVPRDVVFDL